jgi:hypothetical protein
MAAAPDDDARRTLAELEAKLRELERELLRGHEAQPVEAPAPPRPPAAAVEPPAPEPRPVLDRGALDDAQNLLAGLRATVEAVGATASRITTEARAVIEDHGRTLSRMERAAAAAARAERAALEAGRLAATVVVEAGPFADAAAVVSLRDALAAQPGARDAYVRGVEDGRAVIEVHLAPPSPPSAVTEGAEPPGGGTPWA